MRAILEIRFGQLQGKKALIEPGKTLRLGRAEGADLMVPSDAQLSTVHCELAWDGQRCRVRDLESATGTWVNGERAREGVVQHGGWIKAGETVVMVYGEEKTPPRRGSDVAMTAVKARALAALAGEQEPLFALLDAARSERILEVLRESAEEYRSLHEGIQAEGLAEVAPYLVRLPKGCRLLERLVREGWGKRWGIYLTCSRPLKEVRAQLRRFLMVEDAETGQPLYFRFHDPGTLRVFLPAATPRQRAEFFGDIECFWSEEKDGTATRYGRAIC